MVAASYVVWRKERQRAVLAETALGEKGPPLLGAPDRGTLSSGHSASKYKSKPTPKEILDDVANLPILERARYAENFVGEGVRWKGELVELREDYDGLRLMIAIGDRGDSAHAFTTVPKGKYKQLGRVRGPIAITITGEIEAVKIDGSTRWIVVNETLLTFDE